MTTTMSTAKKMIAKFGGMCPICDRKIKAGSDSILYAAGMPVAHADCHEAMGATVCPGYMDQSMFDSLRAEKVARWEAACAKVAPKAPRNTDATELGSFGGSQLAEDMGDYSGR